ncbi:MAG: type II toxin-antitoxin system VapC family toxin [Proteobacteria bacterium]|nr:type II toxin-antitoxin system VapC family toxin [Pseudomonadota bacterium]
MTADKVVDTSALAAIVFAEPRARDAEDLLQESKLFAPSLIRFEMAHICVKKMRERPKDSDLILSQFALSQRIPIQIVQVDYTEVVLLARKFKLSAYDASYLWLAREMNIPLITLDKDLRKAAAKS